MAQSSGSNAACCTICPKSTPLRCKGTMTMSSINQLLAGRRVLVTGAARGLGLSFATAIAEAGASVAMADILEDKLRESVAALKERGFDVHGFTLDLADPASIDACAGNAIER